MLPEDIKAIAHDVLSHRLILNYEAESDGITSRDIVDVILKAISIS